MLPIFTVHVFVITQPYVNDMSTLNGVRLVMSPVVLLSIFGDNTLNIEGSITL